MMANKDAEVSRLNGVFADMLLTAGTGQAQDPPPHAHCGEQTGPVSSESWADGGPPGEKWRCIPTSVHFLTLNLFARPPPLSARTAPACIKQDTGLTSRTFSGRFFLQTGPHIF